jgi:hypothetical protein
MRKRVVSRIFPNSDMDLRIAIGFFETQPEIKILRCIAWGVCETVDQGVSIHEILPAFCLPMNGCSSPTA